jgi:flagellar basal body-associated protein FliL
MKIKQSHGIIVLIVAIAVAVLGYGFLKNKPQQQQPTSSLPPAPTTSMYGTATKPGGCGCNSKRA